MINLFHKVRFHTKRLLEYIFLHPKIIFDYLYLKFHGVETGYGYVVLKGLPLISKSKGSSIILGKGCTLVSKSKYNFAGINHPVILATLSCTAIINIGKTGISGAAICAVKKITIGDDSGVGANSNIYDSDFHAIDTVKRRNSISIFDALCEEVVIGNDVWIASNVTILKGVKIGNESIIGAGSVVTTSIPPKSIYAGNPAKKIKDL